MNSGKVCATILKQKNTERIQKKITFCQGLPSPVSSFCVYLLALIYHFDKLCMEIVSGHYALLSDFINEFP